MSGVEGVPRTFVFFGGDPGPSVSWKNLVFPLLRLYPFVCIIIELNGQCRDKTNPPVVTLSH